MPYPRQAWLELDGQRLDLDDHHVGYATTELNIGFPEVREVVNNNPGRDGVNDRTRLIGSRVVTATIRAWPGGEKKIDEIARLFSAYVWPGVRPELHWVLDTDDRAERMLTLRAADWAGPLAAPHQRELNLGWVAPDPYCYDPAWRVAESRPGETIRNGRVYDLAFDRFYPANTFVGDAPATFAIGGDVPVRPRIRVHGPITAPAVHFTKDLTLQDPTQVQVTFSFDPAVVITTGRWIEIDSVGRQVLDDTGARLEARVDWSQSAWPVLTAASTWTLSLAGTSTSQVTQVRATWREGFLTA